MSCFACCRKPRYKRLVDSLFPEDPQDSTPVASNIDKLLFFAQSSPDHLDQIGAYLAARLRRSLQRERIGHVCVALTVTEKVLADCDARRVQLIADSYLDMVHGMLESSNTDIQIMATNSFVSFSEREEDNTPYHRQYDFFIHRFSSLSLSKHVEDRKRYFETRMAGLRGLRGVIKKICSRDSLQINIWDPDHMNKIIPSFLFNMHDHKVKDIEASREIDEIQLQVEGEIEEDGPGRTSKKSLILLVTYAGLTHIDSVLNPIIRHFDLNKLWTVDMRFAAGVFVTVIETMQKQDCYKVIQSLVNHLDSNVNGTLETKQGILDTLSRCVSVVADGSLGPTVLDIFRTLVRHLRISIESSSNEETSSEVSDSRQFQNSITKTVGDFAGVLPDYHKPDIMELINSYVPVSGRDGSVLSNQPISGVQEHPLAPKDSNPLLSFTLVKCMRAIADTYHPVVLETTFPGHLFSSLIQLFHIREPRTQLDVTCLWHQLVDHHGNKNKIPLNTTWDSLEETGLALGEVSARFASKTITTLIKALYELAKILSTEMENILAFYQLLFLLTLEFSHRGINDMLLYLNKVQELAVKEVAYPLRHRLALHVTVAGILYLIAQVSANQALKEYVAKVIWKRKERTPILLPENLFPPREEANTARASETFPREGEIGDVLREVNENGSQFLFDLQSEGLLKTSPVPSRGSSAAHFQREGAADSAAHFSVSLDYGPDSPLRTDPISFNSLKEKVGLVIGSERGGSIKTGEYNTESANIIGMFDEREAIGSVPKSNPDVSFEELMVKSAIGDDGLGLGELVDIFNTSSTSPTSPVLIPGAATNVGTTPQSAYDLELPSLH